MAKQQHRTEQHKKAMLEALEKTLGIVTQACKMANVGRTQYYQWLRDDEDFAQAVKDINNVTIDFVESQLHKQINEGSTAATIFFLKTKARHRGYQENMDITTDGERIDNTIKVIFEDFSEEKEK
jgi:hypothetical protein